MVRNFMSTLQNNFRKREIFFGIILLINDIVFGALSFFLSFILRFSLDWSTLSSQYVRYYIFYSIGGVLIIIIILFLRKLYNYKNLYKGMGENEGIVISVILSIFSLIIFNYYFHRNIYQLSRVWLIYCVIISIVLLIISRHMTRRFILWLFKKNAININILIIGIHEEGKRIADTFSKTGIEKTKVIGFIDKEENLKLIKKSNNFKDIRILGNLSELKTIIIKHNINRVIISSSDIKYFDIFNLLEKTRGLNIEFQMSPSLFEFSVSRMKIFEYMGIPLIQIQEITVKNIDKFLKFLIDFSMGIILFIIFIFFYSIVGILIKIDSKGPVLYSQERYAKDFRKINIYKFRTMRTGADREEKIIKQLHDRESGFKIKNDPRITRIGHFLRKTSLDELPQIINVLKGELSLVGPRALVIKEGDMLKDWERKRMQVKQGITGLWQISGRGDISYEERMKLDLYYIQNWSIWFELRIIFLTILRILFGKGAY